MNKYKLIIAILLSLMQILIANATFAKSCKKTKPQKQYQASLVITSITNCGESSCDTETGEADPKPYYLRFANRRLAGNQYVYSLIDQSSLFGNEYEVVALVECGQFSVGLPIPLKAGIGDTDTLNMKCVGNVGKQGVVNGACTGNFFNFSLNADSTWQGRFELRPIKKASL